MARQQAGYRQRILEELREHVRNAVPYDLTFAPTGNLTEEEVKRLQDDLKYRFEVWANTWVSPWVDLIEATWIRRKKLPEHRPGPCRGDRNR